MDPLAGGDYPGEWIDVAALHRFAAIDGGRVMAAATPARSRARTAPLTDHAYLLGGPRLAGSAVAGSTVGVQVKLSIKWGFPKPAAHRFVAHWEPIVPADPANPVIASRFVVDTGMAPGAVPIEQPVIADTLSDAGRPSHGGFRSAVPVPTIPGRYRLVLGLAEADRKAPSRLLRPVDVLVLAPYSGAVSLPKAAEVTAGSAIALKLRVANLGSVDWRTPPPDAEDRPPEARPQTLLVLTWRSKQGTEEPAAQTAARAGTRSGPGRRAQSRRPGHGRRLDARVRRRQPGAWSAVDGRRRAGDDEPGRRSARAVRRTLTGPARPVVRSHRRETLDSREVRRPAATRRGRTAGRRLARLGLVAVAGLIGLAAPETVAAHQLTGRIHFADPAWCLPRRGGARRWRLVRDRLHSRPEPDGGPDGADAGASHPGGPSDPARARRDRTRWLVVGRGTGRGRRPLARERRRVAVPLDVRLGRARARLGLHRAGLDLAGPVRLAPSSRRRRHPPARPGGRRTGRLPGSARALAGRRRLCRVRLDGARDAGHQERPNARPRADRVHGDHARRDGPVRPRDVAPQRRGLLDLVRARRSARAARAAPARRACRGLGRAARADPGPDLRRRPPRAGHRPGRARARRVVDGRHPVRRPVTDPSVLRPVRGPDRPRTDAPPVRVARARRRAGHRGQPDRRAYGRSPPGSCRSRSATSSPTT